MNPLVAALGLATIAYAFSQAEGDDGPTRDDSSSSEPSNDGEEAQIYDPRPGGIPSRFDELFEKYGKQYNIPPKMLKAICMNESSLGDDARVAAGDVSYDGKSWGIMQLTLATAGDWSDNGVTPTPELLNDPDYSVRVASRFIKWIRGSFELVELRYDEWCVKSYNQGVQGTKDERSGIWQTWTASKQDKKKAAMANAQTYWERYQRNLKKLG